MTKCSHHSHIPHQSDCPSLFWIGAVRKGSPWYFPRFSASKPRHAFFSLLHRTYPGSNLCPEYQACIPHTDQQRQTVTSPLAPTTHRQLHTYKFTKPQRHPSPEPLQLFRSVLIDHKWAKLVKTTISHGQIRSS